MTELSNEDDLVLTPKLPENKNYRFNKSPLLIPTLSKVIKKKQIIIYYKIAKKYKGRKINYF